MKIFVITLVCICSMGCDASHPQAVLESSKSEDIEWEIARAMFSDRLGGSMFEHQAYFVALGREHEPSEEQVQQISVDLPGAQLVSLQLVDGYRTVFKGLGVTRGVLVHVHSIERIGEATANVSVDMFASDGAAGGSVYRVKRHAVSEEWEIVACLSQWLP